MGHKTKIDWCDSSWNPVTGCLHGCDYCYARKQAQRFGGGYRLDLPPDKTWRIGRMEDTDKMLMGDFAYHSNGKVHILDEPAYNVPAYPAPPSEIEKKSAPYPYYFDPTFHRYRLDIPAKWKDPRSIFVCSMADLFGEWVPDEWIQDVFEACRKAPQHQYLFLTKNPGRYYALSEKGCLPAEDNFWYGSSTPTPETPYFYDYRARNRVNTFVSIEPLHEEFGPWEFDKPGKLPRWIIIGAETGNRKGKIVPEKAWVDEIAWQAERNNVPVFMKESLRALMGNDFRQEFPWEVNVHE